MDEPEVELPWMDGPMPLSEAVEVVAQASAEDSRELEDLRSEVESDGAAAGEDLEELRSELEEVRSEVDDLHSEVDDLDSDVDDLRTELAESADGDAGGPGALDDLRTRVKHLETSAGVECPSCGSKDDVLKSSVAAAVFAKERRLSETNVAALDHAPLVCTNCMTAFTPHTED